MPKVAYFRVLVKLRNLPKVACFRVFIILRDLPKVVVVLPPPIISLILHVLFNVYFQLFEEIHSRNEKS